MEKALKDLIDKLYELEGLALLISKRRDASLELKRLISSKGQEIGEICRSLYDDSVKENNHGKNTDSFFSLDEYSIDDDQGYEYRGDGAIKTPIQEEPQAKKDFENRGKLVFSVNDKFRFRKELFNNSDVDFNNTVALVASMEDYNEAEDYFINEEGFDPANPVVKEFMDIIKRYFQ